VREHDTDQRGGTERQHHQEPMQGPARG
jgi:hypothetical protein